MAEAISKGGFSLGDIPLLNIEFRSRTMTFYSMPEEEMESLSDLNTRASNHQAAATFWIGLGIGGILQAAYCDKITWVSGVVSFGLSPVVIVVGLIELWRWAKESKSRDGRLARIREQSQTVAVNMPYAVPGAATPPPPPEEPKSRLKVFRVP